MVGLVLLVVGLVGSVSGGGGDWFVLGHGLLAGQVSLLAGLVIPWWVAVPCAEAARRRTAARRLVREKLRVLVDLPRQVAAAAEEHAAAGTTRLAAELSFAQSAGAARDRARCAALLCSSRGARRAPARVVLADRLLPTPEARA